LGEQRLGVAGGRLGRGEAHHPGQLDREQDQRGVEGPQPPAHAGDALRGRELTFALTQRIARAGARCHVGEREAEQRASVHLEPPQPRLPVPLAAVALGGEVDLGGTGAGQRMLGGADELGRQRGHQRRRKNDLELIVEDGEADRGAGWQPGDQRVGGRFLLTHVPCSTAGRRPANLGRAAGENPAAQCPAMDPFAVLGVAPDAAEPELSAAYRDLAKRWHPDRGGGEEAQRRMAEINAAYDVLRLGARRAPANGTAAAAPGRRRGGWLADPLRRALGPELLGALAREEPVRLVTPVSTWASPRAILAVTDRRLLWLLDDAPVARVRSLAFRDVEAVAHQLRRPRRRVATLIVHSLGGRRHTFSDLRPHTAATIERHVREAAPRLGGSAAAAG
jgi:hypothetical protein